MIILDGPSLSLLLLVVVVVVSSSKILFTAEEKIETYFAVIK